MADYLYSDGNNNLYRLIGTQLSYEPVETISSSSGIYSGGKPWSKKLTKLQVEELKSLFEAGFRNRTFRAEQRTLGSAEIRIIEEDEKPASIILAMRSPDKENIETYLAEL